MNELIDAFILKLNKSAYPQAYQASLIEFQHLILKQPNLTKDVLEQWLANLSQLALSDNGFELLHTAVLINLNLDCVWFLNKNSLAIFSDLRNKSNVLFTELLKQIDQCKVHKKLFLKSHHFDTVMSAITQEAALPDDCPKLLELFLSQTTRSKYEKILTGLSACYGPQLDVDAHTNNKLHHSRPHALEIKARTLHVAEVLGLYSNKSSVYDFVREIAGFMIEFHDAEQVDNTTFPSVEETTADKIMQWLVPLFSLNNHPDIKDILAFIANRIIVLGTTMVFSLTDTMDLSELYLLIKSRFKRAKLYESKPSNQEFIELIEAFMLLTGIGDKNPAALLPAVFMQTKDSKIATLGLLMEKRVAPLQMMSFFKHETFVPYLKDENAEAYNQQIFLITLVPHLSMALEMISYEHKEQVKIFIQFIADCRKNRTHLNDFSIWYEQEFHIKNIQSIVETIFWNSINAEAGFSLSQRAGLQFAHLELVQRGWIKPDMVTLINTTIPETDAANLKAFKCFYQRLSASDQKTLCSEICLAVVMQAGAIYVNDEITAVSSRNMKIKARNHSGFFLPYSNPDKQGLKQLSNTF